ncbi:VRR-NUC domain-containing protein [Bordetella sp. 02P26C-1]|uniref:VRR-NUC domain-containing protein n=1 Tax=Bordetella sp. 02P26C-1 TaxID=2683195 RepID=UPI0013542078|nr:VRR-NUC domain-containing protein [Bordetella sp. 02P26C-1]MVW80580.1 VRR-NUC domain-containing protein [Bordetella sp. 02P26C-1]
MVPPHRYYYLQNFRRALDVVRRCYCDLLDAREQAFFVNFDRLPHSAQALFVRMAMRRGPWFRASRLVYEEIPDILAAAEALVALGWLQDQADMTLDELFDVCTMPELRAIFGAPAVAARRKGEWLEALRGLDVAPRPYAEWCPGAEPAWRFSLGDHCDRLRLMFFGNLHQDWSEFVLADLGVFRYEAVAFDGDARAFRARGNIDVYLTLHGCRQALEAGTPVPDLLSVVHACVSDNAWLEQRRAKVLFRLGQACERAQDWHTALRVYEQCAYPGARHRRIRVFERLERHQDALALAQEAQTQPESAAELQAVTRMMPRLQRHAGEPRPQRLQRPPIARQDLVLSKPSDPLSVEIVARDHLHTEDAPVYYVENTLINALFGLLFWKAIFAPLPGAFFHPFQRGPADLTAPDFATWRAALLEECFAQLDSDAYRDTVWRHYEEKWGLLSPFVAWGALSDELIRLALDCIPADHLRRFFTRILQDLQNNRTGLPDLIRFYPAERRYELIEIKGPGDKLQDNQSRWLQYCAEHGIAAHVCYVRWHEGETCSIQ